MTSSWHRHGSTRAIVSSYQATAIVVAGRIRRLTQTMPREAVIEATGSSILALGLVTELDAKAERSPATTPSSSTTVIPRGATDVTGARPNRRGLVVLDIVMRSQTRINLPMPGNQAMTTRAVQEEMDWNHGLPSVPDATSA